MEWIDCQVTVVKHHVKDEVIEREPWQEDLPNVDLDVGRADSPGNAPLKVDADCVDHGQRTLEMLIRAYYTSHIVQDERGTHKDEVRKR